MRLWTLQHPTVFDALGSRQHYAADWEDIGQSPAWCRAYRWMAQRMAERGIDCGDGPPIWAWHSGRGWPGEPTVEVAISLLGDARVAEGMVLLELEVPAERVLLSHYGPWNELLDAAMGSEDEPDTSGRDWLWMFDLGAEKPYQDEGLVQACLPHLRSEWVERVGWFKEPSAPEWDGWCDKTWDQSMWVLTRPERSA